MSSGVNVPLNHIYLTIFLNLLTSVVSGVDGAEWCGEWNASMEDAKTGIESHVPRPERPSEVIGHVLHTAKVSDEAL